MSAKRTRAEGGAPGRVAALLGGLVLCALVLYLFLPSQSARQPQLKAVQSPTTKSAADGFRSARSQRAPAPSARAREAGPWSISGQVRGASGRGIDGAAVCMSRHGELPSPEQCVATRSGAFELEQVEEDVAQLLVNASGHLGRAVPVLAPAADAPRHQELEIRLQPGGVQISGRVADMSGGPVPDALILARSGAGAAGVLGVALSGADGRFVASTPEGPLHLTIDADSYAPAEREVSAPVEGLLIGLVPSSSIVGKVVERATGRGLAGLMVQALNRNGLRAGPFEALTAGDGSFEIEGAPAGRYELTAVGRSWRSGPQWSYAGLAASSEPIVLFAQPATTLSASVRSGDAPCLAGWVQVQSVPGAAQRLALLSDGAALFEGVPFGSAWVTVACERPAAESATESVEFGEQPESRTWQLEPVNRAGEPSCDELGSTVRAFVVPSSTLGFLPAARLSDARGAVLEGKRQGNTYSFERVCPGEYDAYLAEAPAIRESFRIQSNDRGRTIEVRLPVPHPEELAGQVFDEQGLPVPDAWVQASPQTTSSGASNVPVLSDGDGRFVISQVFAGIYGVRAESAAGLGELLGVRAGETSLVIRLQPQGSLRGSDADGLAGAAR